MKGSAKIISSKDSLKSISCDERSSSIPQKINNKTFKENFIEIFSPFSLYQSKLNVKKNLRILNKIKLLVAIL